MNMTPGASLDAAISGIQRGVENARKVASQINKQDKTSSSSSSSSSTSAGKGGSSTLGGNIDVKA